VVNELMSAVSSEDTLPLWGRGNLSISRKHKRGVGKMKLQQLAYLGYLGGLCVLGVIDIQLAVLSLFALFNVFWLFPSKVKSQQQQ